MQIKNGLVSGVLRVLDKLKAKNIEADNATITTITGNLSGNATTSSSCTGNATTATTASKLGTNAGSATRPVYFSNGVPVQGAYVWNWSGYNSTPTWVWGGSDGTNMYVYNPAYFSVASAGKLTTARNIALSGDVSGSANFDGSGNITISTTVADNSHNHDSQYYTESEVSNLTPYMTQRDFSYGTLIETDITYNVTNGDAFYLIIEGNVYANLIPCHVQIQGYIYNNTIINFGGTARGQGPTSITAFNNTAGHLCFWFARNGYWEGYNIYCYKVSGSTGKAQKNCVLSVTDGAIPSDATKKVIINCAKILDSENYTNYAPTKTGGGASGTWGINITGSSGSCTGNAASASSVAWGNVTGKPSTFTPTSHTHPQDNNFMAHGNEFNFIPDNFNADIYFNYRSQGGDSTSSTISTYRMCNGRGGNYADLIAKNITGNTVIGAVWNDYAEYRQTKETIEAGRVVCENGDDTLSLAKERLQPGAEIVSDTFGFAIGETEACKTPIAVSGRVLAYPYEDRNSYLPGDAVCAAPGGTVSKMTREEVMKYPERIIGTVSAIPDYETWGSGNVNVNGRIWIKIK